MRTQFSPYWTGTKISRTTKKTVQNGTSTAGGEVKTCVTRRLPGLTNPRAIHQVATPRACSSYEQLGYHISLSPFHQYSRIQELDSQSAGQGVSPHSVG